MSKGSISGNAVLNGINFKCRSLYIRVRRKKGNIQYTRTHYSLGPTAQGVSKQSFKRRVGHFFATTPFLRGIYLLFTTFKRSWKMSLAIYFIFAVFLFSILALSPAAQEALLEDESMVAHILLGVGFLALFIAFLQLSPLAKYHGAEHKAINTVEAGEVPTLENLKKASRISRRCGTIFLTIFMFIFAILLVFSNELVAFFVATSVGYELFVSEQKWLVKSLSPIVYLAILIQKYLTTREPDEEHLLVAQVGILHIKAALDMEDLKLEKVGTDA